MGTIEQAIKQPKFENEHIKANINVLFTANWLYHKISTALKPYGVTHEQFNVLRILKGSHPNCICQKEILSRMIAPSSNLTLIIKKLTAKAFVQVAPSETDRREYQIQITPSGLDLLVQIEQGLKAGNSHLSSLSTSEAFHLNALLDKMREP